MLCLLAWPVAAQAQTAGASTWRLSYDGYASGFHMMTMTADITLGTGGYRIAMAGRSSGLVGFVYHADWQASTEGAWNGAGVGPLRYDNAGTFGGIVRHVALDFAAGDPTMRIHLPADDPEYDPVAPDLTRGAIDELSVMALTLRQMQTAGSCGGTVLVFDGHQLDRNTLTFHGGEVLPPSGRSSFAGVTGRCDVTALTLAGFYRPDPARSRLPRKDSLWFAPLRDGGPLLPVRMTATTNRTGLVTLYLTEAHEIAPGVVATAHTASGG